MTYAIRTICVLPIDAFASLITKAQPVQPGHLIPIASRTAPFNEESPIFELVDEVLAGHDESHISNGSIPHGGKFSLLVAVERDAPFENHALEQVGMWESEDELVHFAPLPYANDLATLSDLDRAYSAGYLENDPRVILAIPMQGVGQVGPLPDLISNLVWIGIGNLIALVGVGGKELRLTSKARQIAQSFVKRGIYGSETIRFWAATRDEWTSTVAAKKLGVSVSTMEEIFDALGYVKRFEDQTWRLGRPEKYALRYQEWIDAEPSARQLPLADD
ncbi:hypothetical protein MUN78_11485 [Leucobacter allii]|uniref:Uncharacterized protein n=1 Tax=Leucobacter allii TaxID=2932247 RepID=A0ABY4FI01_9MICO|nr:hypothetical protein [Leucobacter allii]UOQ56305.1 hypothetical protein MUN78_11485 [Leucobacter allii]